MTILPVHTTVTQFAHSMPDMIALQEFLARQPKTNKRAHAAAAAMLTTLITAAEELGKPSLGRVMDEITRDLPNRR